MPATCPTCLHSTVACTCGLSYAERIRGFQVPASVTPTRTLSRYYDAGALDAQLGGTAKDRRERMMHDTDGLGVVKTDRDGRAWHKNRKTKEVEPVPSKELAKAFGPAGDGG